MGTKIFSSSRLRAQRLASVVGVPQHASRPLQGMSLAERSGRTGAASLHRGDWRISPWIEKCFGGPG